MVNGGTRLCGLRPSRPGAFVPHGPKRPTDRIFFPRKTAKSLPAHLSPTVSPAMPAIAFSGGFQKFVTFVPALTSQLMTPTLLRANRAAAMILILVLRAMLWRVPRPVEKRRGKGRSPSATPAVSGAPARRGAAAVAELRHLARAGRGAPALTGNRLSS